MVMVNVAAHEIKNYTGKKGAGEKKRQRTDFKETECCFSTIVHKTAPRKNYCMWECPGYLGPSGKPTSISNHPEWARKPHNHVEAALDRRSRGP